MDEITKERGTSAALDSAAPKPRCRYLRWVFRLFLGIIVLLALLTLFWFKGALYNHFVGYPAEEAAWNALRPPD